MIPAAIFLEAWQRNADFSWALHKIHCADLEDYERRIVELTCHTSRERLEEFIWELTAESPTPRCRAQIPLKIAQLSQLLAISLPHLNTLFQHLEDDGILRRIDGWLLIPNRNLLWRSNTHPRDRR
jgi:CRP-like cAMP-binding protein